MRNPIRRLKRQLHRYKNFHKIGSGGTAIVYAVKAPSGQQVALKWYIKKPRRHLAASDHCADLSWPYSNKKLFLHPNIVNVLEEGYIKPAPYIVMEYIKGRNLEDKLPSKHKLGACFLEIADALESLHDKGFIHREPNLRNIVYGGEKATLVDCDLMAKEPFEEEEVVICSPDYFTPEHRIDGNHILTRKTDVHMFTAAIYDALTGTTALYRAMPGLATVADPYLRWRYASTLLEIGYDRSIPKNLRVREPEKWNRLFEAGLATKPEQRPDMSELKPLISDAFGSEK